MRESMRAASGGGRAPAGYCGMLVLVAAASRGSIWPHAALAAFLLVLSAALLAFQWRVGRSLQGQSLDSSDAEYLRRQFRRRLQVNLMIGLVGAAVLGGVWVTGPVLMAVYWGAVVLLTFWIGLLAAADIISTRGYLRRVRKIHAAEFRSLANQLRRLRRARDNGEPPREDEASGDPPPAT